MLVAAAVQSRWNESGGSVLWFAVLGVDGLAVLGSFLNLLLLGVSYVHLITEGILCRDVLKWTEDCCHFWGWWMPDFTDLLEVLRTAFG